MSPWLGVFNTRVPGSMTFVTEKELNIVLLEVIRPATGSVTFEFYVDLNSVPAQSETVNSNQPLEVDWIFGANRRITVKTDSEDEFLFAQGEYRERTEVSLSSVKLLPKGANIV